MIESVVFIPTYDYLSLPPFLKIAPLLGPCRTVYLNTHEITVWDEETEQKKKDEILARFDEYRSLRYPQTKTLLT